MKINEVEQLVGISKRNIRFYEKEGLLSPGRNADNGYRDYGEEDVETLRKIKLLRKLDVPLEEIRRMQQGELTLADGLLRHVIQLERAQKNLGTMRSLCQELARTDEQLPNLDAGRWLAEMERMEQEEGTQFVNIRKKDTRKRYVGPVVAAAVFVGLFVILAASANIVSTSRLAPIASELMRNGANADMGFIYRNILFMGVVYLVGALATFAYNRIMMYIAQGTLRTLRDEMFERMQRLPLRFFDANTHGDRMSLYTNDVDTMRQLLSQTIPQILSSCITMVIAIAFMLWYSVSLSLLFSGAADGHRPAERFCGGDDRGPEGHQNLLPRKKGRRAVPGAERRTEPGGPGGQLLCLYHGAGQRQSELSAIYCGGAGWGAADPVHRRCRAALRLLCRQRRRGGSGRRSGFFSGLVPADQRSGSAGVPAVQRHRDGAGGRRADF